MTIEMKLGKAALDKALQNTQKQAKPISNGSQTFQEVLQEQFNGQNAIETMGVEQTNIQSGNGMQALDASQVNVEFDSMHVGMEPPEGTSKIVHMLSEVNQGQLQMDTMMNQILYSGKEFSNQELLAMQAHIYQFAQMTELTVKVASEGVSSIKSLQNTQVQ